MLNRLLVIGVSLLLSGQARAPIVQSVDLSTPFAPVLFSQDGRLHVAYELHVTNFQQVDVSLNALRLTAAGAELVAYRGEDLNRRLTRPGFRSDHAIPQIVGPGQRAIVNLWFPLPASTPANEITHSVDLDVMRATGAVRANASGRVTVRPFQPLNLGAPLGPGQWVAIYDPLLKGGHRTAVYTLDGRARIPGRFAIDFIQMPPSGVFSHPKPRPAGMNGFGSDVLAVADGTVAAAVDDTEDDLTPPVPTERGSGNYISLDIGQGRFAFYEHLQQGSVRVKAGDKVKRGQVIAKLGSSGSTSIGPHLHFHVADTSSLLEAEGMPFSFERFTVFGEFASIDALVKGEPWQPGQLARQWATTRPSPNVVMSFR